MAGTLPGMDRKSAGESITYESTNSVDDEGMIICYA